MSESSANSTGSEPSGSDAEIVFTSAPKVQGTSNGDSCTWYAGGICSRPRSCSDCLNVAIPGQECAISAYGECMSSYALASSGGYPMANFSYCSADDAICASCRTTWTSDRAAGVFVDPTAMCVGETGCICVASCAMANRDDIIVNNWCVPALNGTQFRLVAGLIAGTIALFVVATIMTKRQLALRQRQDVVQREERRAARAAMRETRRPAASAHLPQLNLSGWSGMREKLVSSEQERLGGSGVGTKPTLAMTSTVPPADVEQGDGYRPMSPNDHPPRREL